MTQDSRDSTNFPFELARRLADIKWPPQYDFLYYHQNIARVYVNDSTTHGLLVFHGTGMGKSILAASIAMDAIFPPDDATGVQNSPPSERRRVILLLAKSLASNMQDAIEQYIIARRERGGVDALGEFGALAALPDDKRASWIRRNFSFVTMNASNMLIQMSRATFISEEDEDLLLDTKVADLGKQVANLDNKLLIVDEAHNLFRAIINGSANAIGLYNLIMSARGLKVIFLTGTPIATHPFELAVCFNMLAGKQIFPVHFEDFARLFVGTSSIQPGETSISPDKTGLNPRTHTIINREKFQNRIFGLVSFVNYQSRPGIGAADILANATGETSSTAELNAREHEKQKVIFPERLPLEVVRVPMSIEQYDAYIAAREREKSEGILHAARGGNFDHGSNVSFDDSLDDSLDRGSDSRNTDWAPVERPVFGSARVKVLIRPRQFRARETPALQKPKSVFSSSYRVHSRQIGNYCPPIEIRKRIITEPDELPVQSVLNEIAQFGQIESAKFSAILERIKARQGQLGFVYSQFVGLGGLSVFARFLDQNGYQGRYALITGEVPPNERARIIDQFCDPSNRHGEKIILLLSSSTGAEGIDLKNVRHVHIMEPYWNFGRIKQVEARAIRNASHVDLPPEERNVTTYIYMAVPPLAGTFAKDESSEPRVDLPFEVTSDEELYNSARETQLLIDSFESAIKEVSIECAINHPASERATHCRICAPTGTKLFTNRIDSDIHAPDPCTPITSRKVTAQKIKVGDEIFHYKKADEGSIEERVYGFEVFIEDPRIRAWRKMPVNDVRYVTIVAAINELEDKK